MKKAAFVDIDGTLVKCLTQQILAKKLVKRKFFSAAQRIQMVFWFLLYKVGLVKDSTKIRENIYLSLGSRPKQEVDAIIFDTAEEIADSQIYDKMKNVICSHQMNGDLIFAISGSITDLIMPICAKFEIKNVFATRLLSKNDRYTGAWVGDILEGANKAKLMASLSREHEISLAESFAYADSCSDLPMLEMVGHPVAVNPDVKLAMIASRKNWPVVED